MTPEEFTKLQERFLELRDLNSEERHERLADIERGSPNLANSLRDLLAAATSSASFLDQPIASLTKPTKPGSGSEVEQTREFKTFAENPDIPETIGPYRILQQIGEGGHGIVFMAEQREPIRRKVALKLIKPGMESKMILARFEAERQALALMKHPSIANVIDAGTSDSGSPYFVMELVHGAPLDQFCQENELDLVETLRLFQKVCDAIHHAHRKGVIHRDIKPANVLVTVDSGQPLPKVIDFGIAKAMNLTLTAKTVFTEYGQIIGTLEYMSPEQAMMSQDEGDVRSDVYSLGVLLYVLLTGSPPISKQQLMERGLFELKRTLNDIRPQTPSLRLTTRHEPRTWRQQQSEVENRLWSNRLKGDLDWITMKALEKDQNQRYDSAKALSLDIDNFLTGNEVIARPPSLGYKISRWMVRHRVATSIIGGLILSAITSFAAISWGYYKSQQNLATVREGQRLIAEKATQLEASLKDAAVERRRANYSARSLASKLKRGLLESAWRHARDGDGDTAFEQLQQVSVSERGFAWQFVDSVRQQLNSPPVRHESCGPIRKMAVHAASAKLAVINTESELELWDVPTRQQLSTTKLEPALYDCLEFDSDGEVLLVGANGWLRTIRIKDQSASDKLVHGLGGLRDAAFDRKQNVWFVTTGANYVLKVDRFAQAISKSVRLPKRANTIYVSPNSEQLIVAALDGTAFLLSPNELATEAILSGAKAELVCFSRFKEELVAIDALGNGYLTTRKPDDETITLVPDYVSNETAHSLAAASILEDQSYLVSRRDGTLNLTDANRNVVRIASLFTAISEHQQTASGILIRHFNGRIRHLPSSQLEQKRNSFNRLARVSDGLALASSPVAVTSHDNGTLCKWDTKTGLSTAKEPLHQNEVFAIDVHESSDSVVSFGADWKIRFSKLSALSNSKSVAAGLGVRPVRISNSGRLVAGAPDPSNANDLREGTIDIWDFETRRPKLRLVGHTNWVIQLAFSSDDQLLVSLGLDGTIRTWDLATGDLQKTLDLSLSSPVNSFALIEPEQRILCGHQDGSLSLLDFATGQTLAGDQLLATPIQTVLAPPRSRHAFVCGANTDELTLVHADSLEPIAVFSLGVGRVLGMRTDRRSSRIQILGNAGTSQIYDLPKPK
ncbi:MAG: protein kinase [Planctomycetaceae bacterium]